MNQGGAIKPIPTNSESYVTPSWSSQFPSAPSTVQTPNVQPSFASQTPNQYMNTNMESLRSNQPSASSLRFDVGGRFQQSNNNNNIRFSSVRVNNTYNPFADERTSLLQPQPKPDEVSIELPSLQGSSEQLRERNKTEGDRVIKVESSDNEKEKHSSGLWTHMRKAVSLVSSHFFPEQLLLTLSKKRPKVLWIGYDISLIIHFIMEFGKALHTCGIPAHVLEHQLTTLSAAFGIEGHFYSVPSAIFCSFPSDQFESPYTHMVSVTAPSLEASKIVDLEILAEKVVAGDVKVQDGTRKIRKILDRPMRYGTIPIMISYMLIPACIAQMFEGGWREMVLSAICGLFVGALVFLGAKVESLKRTLEFFAAVLSSIVASILSRIFGAQFSLFLVVFCAVITLVPGLNIVLAVGEIAHTKLVSGSAKFMGALATISILAGGVITGMKISKYINPDLDDQFTPSPTPEWVDALILLLVSIGFTISLKAKAKEIWIIVLSCSIGMFGGKYISRLLGSEVGAFFGALGIAVLSNLYVRIFHNAVASVPIYTGTLLLVPGAMGLRAMISLGSGAGDVDNLSNGLLSVLRMFFISFAIIIGLLTANFLIPSYKAL